MPVDFLTEAERERWQRLPDTMPQDDLFVFFLLSDDDRRETQTDHQLHVQAYLKFRRATPLDFYALHTWLVERALEHDKPTLLLQLTCEKLYREKIVRPGVTRLERLVATARDQAHDETFRRLTPLLTDERKAFLDGLLTPDPQ